MKQFVTAARRGAPAVNNPEPITFLFDERELTASPPTTGQLALFTYHQAEGGLGAVRALFNLLAAVLSDEDYAVVEESLQDGVELTVVTEIINYLIEEWSARPTSPPSVSSGSRRSTGPQSTAKPRAKVVKIS